MKVSCFVSALLAGVATATPTRVLEKRATTWCDSYGSLETGGYTIYHNNWGSAQATSGSQCTTFDSVDSSGSVVWSTSWTWAGGSSSVKSYSNVALVDVNKQLSAISSIPSTYKWTYTGTDIVANVAYDLWLAPTASADDNEYEIMIWLAALGGAGPISSTGSSVATVTIAGYSWSLYTGNNGEVDVFSFVASEDINSFDGDLNEFFTYLTENQGISTSMYATTLQGGSEPFTGTDAVLDVTGFSMSVSTGASSSSGSSSSAVVASSTAAATSAAATSASPATSSAPVVVSEVATTSASPVTSEVPVVSEVATTSTPVTFATSIIPVSQATSVAAAPSETPVNSVPAEASTPSVPQASPSATPTKGKGRKCHT